MSVLLSKRQRPRKLLASFLSSLITTSHELGLAHPSNVHGMAPLDASDLQRIFEKLDRNGDGLVSLEELNWVLERIGVHLGVEELETLVEKPSLSFDEFLFFCESIIMPNNNNEDSESDGIIGDEEESDIYKAFKVFDLDGDGLITSEELQNVLGRLGLWDERSGGDCRGMILVYDTNSDGVLDFQEFKNMMLPSSTAATVS